MLASILAKLSRDRFMDEISPLYANYNFHKHKGYGTKAHIEAIRESLEEVIFIDLVLN